MKSLDEDEGPYRFLKILRKFNAWYSDLWEDFFVTLFLTVPIHLPVFFVITFVLWSLMMQEQIICNTVYLVDDLENSKVQMGFMILLFIPLFIYIMPLLIRDLFVKRGWIRIDKKEEETSYTQRVTLMSGRTASVYGDKMIYSRVKKHKL